MGLVCLLVLRVHTLMQYPNYVLLVIMHVLHVQGVVLTLVNLAGPLPSFLLGQRHAPHNVLQVSSRIRLETYVFYVVQYAKLV